MLVLAQLSTSVSDDQIRLIIIALLVVAVLLALITIWYFVKTSPSRRVRAARARREAAGGRQRVGEPSEAQQAPRSSASQRPAAAATAPSSVRVDEILDRDQPDDEWDRLTAPEPRRSSSS